MLEYTGGERRGHRYSIIILSELIDNIQIPESLACIDHNEVHFNIHSKANYKNKQRGNYIKRRDYFSYLEWNYLLKD